MNLSNAFVLQKIRKTGSPSPKPLDVTRLDSTTRPLAGPNIDRKTFIIGKDGKIKAVENFFEDPKNPQGPSNGRVNEPVS